MALSISPKLAEQVVGLAGDLSALFSNPDYIPGCKVVSIADISQYASNNGWIECLVGQHNRQRVRYKGNPAGVAVDDYVDVVFYPDISVFICVGAGGTGAITTGGGRVSEVYDETLTNLVIDVDASSIATFAAGAQATEGRAGAAELGTQTETDTGTDDVRIVTPLKLAAATTVVHPARTISTTAPLTGGGDLSANRTLAVSTATEAATGVAEIATQAEVTTGTDDARLITPLKLATRLSGTAITNSTTINATALGTPMTNSSGAAVVAGDIGYMGSDGAFYTTTTPNFFTESMLAVVIGGANGATIYVTKTGLMILNYVGADPAAGDYLVTSNTAGKVTALLDISSNTYMSPEVIAVATAAGSSSVVLARLLLNTNVLDVDQTVNIFQTLAGSAPPSDFSGTIASLPTGTSLTYTPTGGNENAMDTAASTDSAKIILHNTTRGTSATISTVVVGTNTINFVTAYPSGSQVGDSITIRSQTNTSNLGTARWVDLDLQSTLSGLARTMIVELQYGDGTTNNRGGMHPWTTDTTSKRQLVRNTSATVVQFAGQLAIPIINNRICVLWQSGGTAANLLLQLRGMKLAAP